MERDDVVNARVPADVKAALKKAADADQRTVSALVGIILGEWLKKNGFLKTKRAGAGKRG